MRLAEMLEPGDVFFTQGQAWMSKAIRFFTRRIGESRTVVNHVGVIVVGGPLHEAVGVEALDQVKEHPLATRYGPPARDLIAVFRPVLSAEEKAAIVAAARAYVGRGYGWAKLGLHFMDWLLQGAYVFRRLGRMDNYPICSWLVAHAFKKVGKDFGVAAGAATPDDMWDFCVKNKTKYEVVRVLSPWTSP